MLLSLIFLTATAHAIPAANRLVQPDKVSLNARGKVEIHYTLPCQDNESSTVVMTNDDTGDLKVAVGIVASLEERNCKPGPLKRFKVTVDAKKTWGFDCAADACAFRPMPVADEADRKLEAYVRTRLSGPSDEKTTVQRLIDEDAEAPMILRPESLRCMGYPSWEGNGKIVGTCHIDAGDWASAGDHLHVRYAIIVGDDTEHPGEHRSLQVMKISSRI